MQQAFDAVTQSDKCAVVGQRLHRTFDFGADGEAGGDVFPRVLAGLLHAERDFLLLVVDFENHHVDFLTGLELFGWVRWLLAPADFADVDQTFDAVFELHEGAVVHQVDHFAHHGPVFGG